MAEWRRFLKVTAFLTLVCFVMTTVESRFLYAEIYTPEISRAIPSVENIGIASDLGTVDETFRGSRPETVILVQDAHCNFDAQTHIRAIIGEFQQKYGLDLVAFEGGEGELDFLAVRAFPYEEVKKNILNEYVKRGELSGVELAAALNPRESFYYAIEDAKVYQANREAFLEVYSGAEAASRTIRTLFDTLDPLRKEIYSPALFELEEKRRKSEEEPETLMDFIRLLRGKAKESGIAFEAYPLLANLLAQAEAEAAFEDARGDAAERARLFIREADKALLPLLAGSEKKEFGRKTQEFRTGILSERGMLKYLAALAEKSGLSLAGEEWVRERIGSTKELAALKGSEFFREIRNLADAVKAKLFRNERERLLDRLCRNADILKDLLRLELTRDDFRYFQEHREEFSPEFFETSLARLNGTADLEMDLSGAERFYELALRRDKVLFGNLKSLLGKRGEKFALLVAGGFHAEGIKQELRSAGISYAVISPAIREIGGNETYLRVMKGDVSYRESSRSREELARMILPGNSKAVSGELRDWRSSIINRALREGKIAVAKEYTRYVDALFEMVAAQTGRSALATEAAALGAYRQEFFESVTADLLTGSLKTVLKDLGRGAMTVDDLAALLEDKFETLVGRETLRKIGADRERYQKESARIGEIRGMIRSDAEFLGAHVGDLQALYDRGELSPERFREIFLDSGGARKIFESLLAAPEQMPSVPAEDALLERLRAFDVGQLIQAKIDASVAGLPAALAPNEESGGAAVAGFPATLAPNEESGGASVAGLPATLAPNEESGGAAENYLGIRDEASIEAVRRVFEDSGKDVSLARRLAYLERAIEFKAGPDEAASLGGQGKPARHNGKGPVVNPREIGKAADVFWKAMTNPQSQTIPGLSLNNIRECIRAYRIYYLHSAQNVRSPKEITAALLEEGILPGGDRLGDFTAVSPGILAQVQTIKRILSWKDIARVTGHDPVLEEQVLRVVEDYSRDPVRIRFAGIQTFIPSDVFSFVKDLLVFETNRFLGELLRAPIEELEKLPGAVQEKLLDAAGNRLGPEDLTGGKELFPRLEFERSNDQTVTRILLEGPFGEYRERILRRLNEISGTLDLRVQAVPEGDTGIKICSAEAGRAQAINYIADQFPDLLRRIEYSPGAIDAKGTGTAMLADAEGVFYEIRDGEIISPEQSLAHPVTREALLSYLAAGGILVLFSDENAEMMRKRITLEGEEIPAELSGKGVPADSRRQIFAVSNDGAVLSYFGQDGSMREIVEYRKGLYPRKPEPGGMPKIHAAYLCGNCDPSRRDYPALKKMGTGWAVLVSEEPPSGPEFQRNYLGNRERGTAAFLRATAEAAEAMRELSPQEKILFARKNLHSIIDRAREILSASSLGKSPEESRAEIEKWMDSDDQTPLTTWLEASPALFTQALTGSRGYVQIAPGLAVLKILNLSSTYLSDKEQAGILSRPVIREMYRFARRRLSAGTWTFLKEIVKRILVASGRAHRNETAMSGRGYEIADRYFRAHPDYPVKTRVLSVHDPEKMAAIHDIPRHIYEGTSLWMLQNFLPKESFLKSRVTAAVREKGDVEGAKKILSGAIDHLFSVLAPEGVMDTDAGINIFENMILTDEGRYGITDWDAVTDNAGWIADFFGERQAEIEEISAAESLSPALEKALLWVRKKNSANHVANVTLAFYSFLPAEPAEELSRYFLEEVRENFTVEHWNEASAQASSLGGDESGGTPSDEDDLDYSFFEVLNRRTQERRQAELERGRFEGRAPPKRASRGAEPALQRDAASLEPARPARTVRPAAGRDRGAARRSSVIRPAPEERTRAPLDFPSVISRLGKGMLSLILTVLPLSVAGGLQWMQIQSARIASLLPETFREDVPYRIDWYHLEKLPVFLAGVGIAGVIFSALHAGRLSFRFLFPVSPENRRWHSLRWLAAALALGWISWGFTQHVITHYNALAIVGVEGVYNYSAKALLKTASVTAIVFGIAEWMRLITFNARPSKDRFFRFAKKINLAAVVALVVAGKIFLPDVGAIVTKIASAKTRIERSSKMVWDSLDEKGARKDGSLSVRYGGRNLEGRFLLSGLTGEMANRNGPYLREDIRRGMDMAIAGGEEQIFFISHAIVKEGRPQDSSVNLFGDGPLFLILKDVERDLFNRLKEVTERDVQGGVRVFKQRFGTDIVAKPGHNLDEFESVVAEVEAGWDDPVIAGRRRGAALRMQTNGLQTVQDLQRWNWNEKGYAEDVVGIYRALSSPTHPNRKMFDTMQREQLRKWQLSNKQIPKQTIPGRKLLNGRSLGAEIIKAVPDFAAGGIPAVAERIVQDAASLGWKDAWEAVKEEGGLAKMLKKRPLTRTEFVTASVFYLVLLSLFFALDRFMPREEGQPKKALGSQEILSFFAPYRVWENAFSRSFFLSGRSSETEALKNLSGGIRVKTGDVRREGARELRLFLHVPRTISGFFINLKIEGDLPLTKIKFRDRYGFDVAAASVPPDPSPGVRTISVPVGLIPRIDGFGFAWEEPELRNLDFRILDLSLTREPEGRVACGAVQAQSLGYLDDILYGIEELITAGESLWARLKMPMKRRTFLQILFGGFFTGTLLARARAAENEANFPAEGGVSSPAQSFSDFGAMYLESIFNMTDAATGLPIDLMRVDEQGKAKVWIHETATGKIPDLKTSPTNIGARLASIIAWLETNRTRNDPKTEARRERVLSDVSKILTFLERAKTVDGFYHRYYWLNPSQRDSNGMPMADPNSEISSIDNANLTAGLIAAAGFFAGSNPDLGRRFLGIVRGQNYAAFYDRYRGLMTHGFKTDAAGKRENLPNHYGQLFTEARLLAFLAVVLSKNPAEMQAAWRNLEFDSWGGSLFEYLMPGIFLDEENHGAGYLADALRYAVEVQKDEGTGGYWGRSPAFNDALAYEESGSPRLGKKGYGLGSVSPYSWGLAAITDPGSASLQFKKLAEEVPGFFSQEVGGRDSFNPVTKRFSPMALSCDNDFAAAGLSHAVLRMRGEKTVSDRFWEGLKLLGGEVPDLGERLLDRKETGRTGPDILAPDLAGRREVRHAVEMLPASGGSRRLRYDATAGGAFFANIFEPGFSLEGYDVLQLEMARAGDEPFPAKFRIEIKRKGYPDRVFEVFGSQIGAEMGKTGIPLFTNRWSSGERRTPVSEIVFSFWPEHAGRGAQKGAVELRSLKFLARGTAASLGMDPALLSETLARKIIEAVSETGRKAMMGSPVPDVPENVNQVYDVIRDPDRLAQAILKKASETPEYFETADRESVLFAALKQIVNDPRIAQSRYLEVYEEILRKRLKGEPGTVIPYDASRLHETLLSLSLVRSGSGNSELDSGKMRITSNGIEDAEQTRDLRAGAGLLNEVIRTERRLADLAVRPFFWPICLLREEKLKEIHKVITAHTPVESAFVTGIALTDGGRYRYADTHRDLHLYPSPLNVENLMAVYFGWLGMVLRNLNSVYDEAFQTESLPEKDGMPHPAVLVAAQAFNRFLSIHPFDNGNTRTASLIANYILTRYGYPPFWLTEKNRKSFYAIQRFAAMDPALFGNQGLYPTSIRWDEIQERDTALAAFFADEIGKQAAGSSLGEGFGRFEIPEIRLNDDWEITKLLGVEARERPSLAEKGYRMTTTTGREVFVCDNHQKVVSAWLEAFRKGLISKGAGLLHIDAHADALISKRPFGHLMDLDKIPEMTPGEIESTIEKFYGHGSFIPAAVAMGLIDPLKWRLYKRYIKTAGPFSGRALAESLVWSYSDMNPPVEFSHEWDAEGTPLARILGGEPADIIDLDIDVFVGLPEAEVFEKWVPYVAKILSHAKVVTIATSPDYIDQEYAVKITSAILEELNRIGNEAPALPEIPDTRDEEIAAALERERTEAEKVIAELDAAAWEAIPPVDFAAAQAIADRFELPESALKPEFQTRLTSAKIAMLQEVNPRLMTYWKLQNAFQEQNSEEAFAALAGLYKNRENLPPPERLSLERFVISARPVFLEKMGKAAGAETAGISLGQEGRDFGTFEVPAIALRDGITGHGKDSPEPNLVEDHRITTSTGRRIFVGDHHQKAAAFYLEAFKDGVIPEGSGLLHIDAHPDDRISGALAGQLLDLDKIKDMTPEEIEKFVMAKYNIDTYLAPLAAMGLIDPGKWWFCGAKEDEREFPNSVSPEKLVWGLERHLEGNIVFNPNYSGETVGLRGLLDPAPLDIIDLDIDFFAPHYNWWMKFYREGGVPEAEARARAKAKIIGKWVPEMAKILARGKIVSIATSPGYIEQDFAAEITTALLEEMSRIGAGEIPLGELPEGETGIAPWVEKKTEAADGIVKNLPGGIWEEISPLTPEEAAAETEALWKKAYPRERLEQRIAEPLSGFAEKMNPRLAMFWKLMRIYRDSRLQGGTLSDELTRRAMAIFLGLYKNVRMLSVAERVCMTDFISTRGSDHLSRFFNPWQGTLSDFGASSLGEGQDLRAMLSAEGRLTAVRGNLGEKTAALELRDRSGNFLLRTAVTDATHHSPYDGSHEHSHSYELPAVMEFANIRDASQSPIRLDNRQKQDFELGQLALEDVFEYDIRIGEEKIGSIILVKYQKAPEDRKRLPEAEWLTTYKIEIDEAWRGKGVSRSIENGLTWLASFFGVQRSIYWAYNPIEAHYGKELLAIDEDLSIVGIPADGYVTPKDMADYTQPFLARGEVIRGEDIDVILRDRVYNLELVKENGEKTKIPLRVKDGEWVREETVPEGVSVEWKNGRFHVRLEGTVFSKSRVSYASALTFKGNPNPIDVEFSADGTISWSQRDETGNWQVLREFIPKPSAQALGAQENFNRYLWSLVGEKYGLQTEAQSFDSQRAIDFFFAADTDREAVLKELGTYLERQLNGYEEGLKSRTASALPDFTGLAGDLLTRGLDREKIAAELRRARPDLPEESVQGFISGVEGVLAGAAIHAEGEFLRGEDPVSQVLMELAAEPAELAAALQRLLARWNMAEATTALEAGVSETNMALAVHLDSLPEDLAPEFVHDLFRRLGERGRLFLIYPSTDVRAGEKVRELKKLLLAGEKNKLTLRSYVEGAPYGFEEIAGKMRQVPRAIRMVIAPRIEGGVSTEEVLRRAGGRVSFCELQARSMTGGLPEFLFSMLIASSGDPALLLNLPPEAVSQKPLANGGLMIAFNVAALAALLSEEIKALRSLETAA